MSPYLSTAAIVMSMALSVIGLAKWSAKRITEFDDTQPMATQEGATA